MRSRPSTIAFLSALIALLIVALPVFSKKNPPDHPIDLNVANEKELEELPGVGPTTAKAIIDFREKSGRFRRVEDLLVIRGVSETKLKKMRPYVTVGPSPAKPASGPTKSPAPKTSSSSQSKPNVAPKAPPAAAGSTGGPTSGSTSSP